MTVRPLIALALLASTGSAGANVYCIKNNQDLADALYDIRYFNGTVMTPATNFDDFDLRFVSGTFTPPPPPSGEAILNLWLTYGTQGTYRVSGGWLAADNCATQRLGTSTQERTRILAGGAPFARFQVSSSWNAISTTVPRLIEVDHLEILDSAQAIMAIKEPTTAQKPYRYNYRLRVDAVTIEAGAGAVSATGHHGFSLSNSFIQDLDVGVNGTIVSWSSEDVPTQIYNNTFRSNTGSGQYPAVLESTSSNVLPGTVVRNNIFMANSGMPDVRNFSATALVFSNNRITGTPGAGVIALNNTTVDPKFASASSGELQPDSPMRDLGAMNSSVASVVGNTDRNGATRVMGDTIDLGAYEVQAQQLSDPLFASSFE